MTERTCKYCGETKKNLGSHERFCKMKPKIEPIEPHNVNDIAKIIKENQDYVQQNRLIRPPLTQEPVLKEETLTIPQVPAPANTFNKKKWYHFWKNSEKPKMPSTILSTQEIKDLRISNQIDQLTDEQKFLRFFGNLPKWTTKKPGWFKTWKLGDRLKHCVLVSSDPKKQDVELFLLYNKELGLLQSDTAFYDMPIKEKGTIYLNADKFAPIINGNNYGAEFDIPEDFANSLINRGIKFGQLSQFKAVLDKIDKMMIICWLLGGVLVLSIIVNILTVHSGNNAIHDMGQQIGNLTSTINSMKGNP